MRDYTGPKVYAMTQYIHKQTGQPVELESWRWEAYYNDGSVLKQFDKLDEEHGEFHQFAEIDQNRLEAFKMVNGKGGVYTLVFTPGEMKLIHKYRMRGMIQQRYEADGQPSDERILRKYYMFGYQKTNGEKCLMFITPNDDLVITDDDNKITLQIPTREVA